MATALPADRRLEIYDRYRAGETLSRIAGDLGIHYETARKWARVGRRHGRKALASRPRKCPGLLHNVPDELIGRIKKLRKAHRSWGLTYLRQQLLHDPTLGDELRAAIPSQASFYRYIHSIEQEPFRRRLKNDLPSTPLIAQAEHPHHLWQADLKEKNRVAGLAHQVTVLNIRDVYSSVTVGAQVFELIRDQSTLAGHQVQAACRLCFAQWGLPDRLRTDNGSCFVGNSPQNGFPSYLSLWLRGLGIVHETIETGRPTQNGCVERFNRTYNNLVLRDGPFASLSQLELLSAATVEFLNTTYPSRAGHCNGRPPLCAHPEAAAPRRPYTPEQEAKLFDLGRVDAYLAKCHWRRRSDKVGKVSMGRVDYYMGRANAGQAYDVTFDATDRHFVFARSDRQSECRRPALGLDAQDIMHAQVSEHIRLRNSENAA